jgi:5-methylthioribose kinase
MDKVEESGSGYEVLTEESAARWLWRLAEARELLGGSGPSEWSVAEVGDGNLNLVFIVQGPDGALVVKQVYFLSFLFIVLIN